jgi:hypothetical protein
MACDPNFVEKCKVSLCNNIDRVVHSSSLAMRRSKIFKANRHRSGCSRFIAIAHGGDGVVCVARRARIQGWQANTLDDVAGCLLARLGSAGGTIDASCVQFAPECLLTCASFLLAFSEDLNCGTIGVFGACSLAFLHGFLLQYFSEYFDHDSVVMTVAIFAFSEPNLTAATLNPIFEFLGWDARYWVAAVAADVFGGAVRVLAV